MNHKYLFIAALALGMAPTVYAQTYTDSARVMGVEPQYSNVRNTRRECTQEWVTVQSPPQQAPQSRNYGGAIVGGLVGGVIGHQFGGGQGKDLATAAGVTLGAIAGDQHTNGGSYTSAPQPEQRQVERCYNVNEVQPQVTGYHVTYEYRGQLYSVLMRNRPSEVINVRVTVNPID